MSKVLIVVDMQNDFITGSLGSEEARAIVPKVAEKIKDFEGEVIFTRDTHYSDYMETLEGKYLPVEHCIFGTEGWEIIPELDTADATVIDKITFGYKDWEKVLQDAEPDTEFELCGVCTDICVISNALALRMLYPNAKITVDAACMAGVTPEKHNAALEVMKSCQIDVIND